MFAVIHSNGLIENPTLPKLYKHPRIVKVQKSTPSNNRMDSDQYCRLSSQQEKTLGKSVLVNKIYGNSDRSHFVLPNTHINTIMSTPAETLTDCHTVKDAFQVVSKKGYRHIPIVSEETGVIRGIISDRDLLVLEKIDKNAKITTIMKEPVLTARVHAEIRFAALVMIKQHIGSLPVVTNKGVVQGLVTRSDILRTFVGQIPIELII